MRGTLTVFRHEIRSLFVSPIAWLLLAIFICQSAFLFTRVLEVVADYQLRDRNLNFLTGQVFTNGLFSVLGGIQKSLLLYVPLMTMGLMARERNAGSLKLLMSSPVSLRGIILGKFLAVSAYFCIFGIVLLAFMVIGHLTMNFLDVQWFLTALFGLMLTVPQKVNRV